MNNNTDGSFDGDDDDPGQERLERALRRAVAFHDPMPARVLESARASFTWRMIDAELASLVHDSLTSNAEAILVRSSTMQARQLTFEASGLALEVEVLPQRDGRCRLLGQLTPSQPAEITVEHASGVVTTPADALGRFLAEGVTSGLFRIRCQLAGEASYVVTSWVEI